MKIILTLFLATLLAGCSDQEMDRPVWVAGDYLCRMNGTAEKVSAEVYTSYSTITARCKDKTRVTFKFSAEHLNSGKFTPTTNVSQP